MQRSFGHGSLLVDKVKTPLHTDGIFTEYRALTVLAGCGCSADSTMGSP